MWLLNCGMQRSGSVLQYRIASKIAEFHPKAHLVGWVPPSETEVVLGTASDAADELSIAKLHNYDDAVDAFWDRFHPKAMYIYRDVRDVVVSTMNMEGCAFDSIEIASTLYYILRNYDLWTQKPGVLISRYEDVMAEGGLLAEVGKIAEYIEVALTSAQIEQIADAVSIKESKRFIEQFDYEKKGVQYPNTRFDPQSLLHSNHIHSGASEQWRAALTPEQIAVVEVWSGDWLEARGYALSQPQSAEAQIETLRRMLEALIPQASQQIEVISGLKAYIERMPVVETPPPAETEVIEAAEDAAQEIALLQSEAAELREQIEVYERQLAAMRQRKIARVMRTIGRPIV